MSFPRLLTSSSSIFSRIATSSSAPISRSCCANSLRNFSSSRSSQSSSKRQLQTATAHRPQTLDPPPPPPINTPPEDISVGVSRPRVNDIRPPWDSEGRQNAATSSTQERPNASAKDVRPEASKPTSTSSSTSPKSKLRSKLRPRKAAMTLTPTALSHLRSLLDQPEPKLIRVGVKNRGCSGLAYHLEYVEKPGAFDETVEQDGVKVLIDSKALFSIIGSEMDWVEDKLNERFVFRNPNIKEQCGCGESFMV